MDSIGTERWARARAAYLAGETAAVVCRRFKLGRSAFFAAAQAGGWRRTDRTVSDHPTGDAPGPVGEALPCIDLAETAMARASDAVMGGRLHEAQCWTRLAGELRRLAREETACDSWTETLGHTIDQEAHGHYMADKLAETPDSPDSLDSERTPVSAVTYETRSPIRAEPDSLDYPPQTGLHAPAALPRTFEDMPVWVKAEAAKMERRDRACGALAAGGP
jgi:hypothetical protein